MRFAAFGEGEPLSEIWWQGRQWAVTAYGLECRDGSYTIEKKRLLEENWIRHVGQKCWTDVDDLATAYLVAIALHGFTLTEPRRAFALRGYAEAVVFHEHDRIYEEMFPRPSGHRFEALHGNEFHRQWIAVEAEYRKRKATEKVTP